MKLRWRLLTGLALVALVPAAARAQTTVTGQVTDANTLRPLTGAQVLVKGTSIGVLTDTRGHYALAVPAGRDSLQFTYLGYGSVTRAVAPVVNVALQVQAVALQGLVVTALGIEREKRSISYSAQTINTQRLNAVPTANMVSALEGDAAGVHITSSTTPGGSARIVLRGESSITGNNQPLFVVDGVPIDNSSGGATASTRTNNGFGGGTYQGYDLGNAAGDINPQDIESITVLKGPNAAALYGSRAANGAIVITTKNGTGRGIGGWGVSATIGAQLETPLKLPDYQNSYGGGSYGAYDFVDGNGGGTNDFYDESWGPKLDGRTSGCVFTPGQNPTTPQDAAQATYDSSVPCHQFFGVGPWIAHPNNVRDFFNTGRVANLNVAVSRSNESSNVRFSVARRDENGMYPTNRMIRTNVALNGGTTISSKLSTQAMLNYIRDDNRDLPSQAYTEADPMQGFIWFNRNVDINLLKQNLYRNPSDPLTQQILAGNPTIRTDAPIPYSWQYAYHPNPYWMAEVKQDYSTRDRVIGNGSATYKFNDWLSLTGRIGQDWYQNHFRTNVPVNAVGYVMGGGLTDVAETRSELNSDFLATLHRKLMPSLDFTLNAGGNSRIDHYSNNTACFGVCNSAKMVIPGLYTLENASSQPYSDLYLSKKQVNSLYGSANFDYKGWFNVDLTGRNDWSSTLPAKNNSFFYPSIGGAFVFTDALGIHSNILNYGKLRASWTRVGNDTDPYQLQAVYANGTPWAGLPSFAVSDRLFNADLKPEQTTGMEAGAELSFLNSRLVLTPTVYQKSTVNQIFPVSVSASTGFTSRYINGGQVRNRGLELELSATPVQTANFRWNVNLNWAKNTSRVMSLAAGVPRYVIGTYWGISVTADSGQPYGNLVGVKWKRSDGHIVVDSTGLPIPDNSQVPLGNYSPKWNGGISNTFTYKNLSLSVLLDGQYGGNIYSVTKWFGQYSGVLANTLNGRQTDWCSPGITVPNSVVQTGEDAQGKPVYGPYSKAVCPQTYWENTFYANEDGMLDASYLKLRDARLSFNLPQRFVKRMGFSAATFSLVGHDLFLWSKNSIIDPETNFDASNVQGIEQGQLPTPRTIGFTLSVQP